MAIRTTLAAALVLATCGTALADPAYDACIDAAGAVDSAMGECGGAWLEREDARLNAAWKSAFRNAEGATKASLLAEQRAWIAFKDASCLFYSQDDAFGTAGRNLSFPACRADVVIARTKALADIGAFLSEN